MEIITGQVFACETRERIAVSGSGGGGSIDRGSGRISEVQIATRQEVVQEIWIRSAPGIEEQLIAVSRPDQILKLRSEHIVSAIRYRGELWGFKNHSQGVTQWRVDAKQLAQPKGGPTTTHVLGALFAVSFLVPVICLSLRTPIMPWLLLGWASVIGITIWSNKSAAASYAERVRYWQSKINQAEALLGSANTGRP